MTGGKQAMLVLRPGRGQIVIDGKDISTAVCGLILHADHKSVPNLQLDLLCPDLLVNGEMQVTIPDRTAAALIELGWTPPQAETTGDEA